MLQLQIETIAYCNARCVFCAYPTMKRPRGRMEDSVYEKILRDAKELELFMDRISLQGLGEPLMDKGIVERVALARRSFPDIELSIYTNGSLLTVEKARRLAAAGLDKIVVSLTGTNAAERKAAMGLADFDRVTEQLDQVRRIVSTDIKLIAARDLIEDMTKSPEAFRERWGSDSFVTWEGNWAGDVWPFRGAPQTKKCHRAVQQIMFLWDGTMSLCCFDAEGRMTFGNIKDHTVRELWESPERTRIRDLHRTGRRTEVALCKGCSGI